MKKLKPMRQSIILPLLILIISAFFILEIMLFNIFTYSFQSSSTSKMNNMTERITRTLQSSANSYISETELVERCMLDIKSISSVEIAFFDRTGKLMYNDQVAEINKFFNDDFIRVMNYRPGLMEHYKVKEGKYHDQIFFYFSAPINSGKLPNVAYIGMARYMSVYEELNDKLLMVVTGITLAFAIIIVYISDLITKRLTKPMHRLEEYAKAVGDKYDHEFVPDENIRELNILGNCIQDMVQKRDENEAKQRVFFENVSHELHTPIMALQGYAEGLREGVFPDPDHALDVIYKESVRLRRLVDGILLLSRLDNDIYDQNPVENNLNDFLYEINDTLAAVFAAEGKELSINCHEDIAFTADALLLRQALSNPISNAFRHCKKGVHVFAEADKSAVRIRVSDDGSGFSEEVIHSVFERFRKDNSGHIGLGLAIAKAAVEAIGGEVCAYNEEERGGAVIEIMFYLL